MAVKDHSTLPMFVTNRDLSYHQPNLCVPDCKKGLPYSYRTYEVGR